MQDLVIEFMRQTNALQLVAMAVMLWFFYNRLDKKIEKVDKDIEKVDKDLGEKIEKSKTELKADINKLSDKVEDIDRRICRIEGSLATQGHCLFGQQKQEKQAL